ncbi:MAG: ABC transporter permease [Actinomycetota bacterium]
MSLSRSWAVAKHDLRILRSDPAFLLIMTGMPLIIMAFIKPAFTAGSAPFGGGGGPGNGAEHAVPGVTVMFAFFLVGNVGFGVFREHGWNTWERLRASRATPAEVMAGKVVVPLMTLALQLTVLIGLGGVLFDLDIRGSLLAMVAVATALALCLVSMGLFLLAVTRTIMQLNAISNLGTMLFAGLGGSLAPISVLPDWARTISPATPSYWAMRGFRDVIDGGGLSEAALPVAVLLAFALGFGALAALRFHFDEVKVSFA